VTAIRPRPGSGVHTDLLCTDALPARGACIPRGTSNNTARNQEALKAPNTGQPWAPKACRGHPRKRQRFAAQPPRFTAVGLQRRVARACPTRLRWLGQADDLLRAKTLQRPWLFGRRNLQRNQSHLAVEDRNTALRRHRIRSPNHAVLVRRPRKTDLADTRKDGRHRSRFGMHRLQCRSRHTVVRT
jgi:hypothetical protein